MMKIFVRNRQVISWYLLFICKTFQTVFFLWEFKKFGSAVREGMRLQTCRVCHSRLIDKYTLRKLVFHFLSNWMGYDGGDSFHFDFEPNWNPFGSKSNVKLSPRSYAIQFERKWNISFLSIHLVGHSPRPGIWSPYLPALSPTDLSIRPLRCFLSIQIKFAATYCIMQYVMHYKMHNARALCISYSHIELS